MKNHVTTKHNLLEAELELGKGQFFSSVLLDSNDWKQNKQ